MQHFIKTTLVAAAVLLAIDTTAPDADARALPAYGGKPWNPDDATCFSEWYGTVTNNCSGSRPWFMPLVVDPAGWYNGRVRAYGASSSNNVYCGALGVDENATSYWGGVYNPLPAFGSSQSISVSAYVPAGGSLFAICWMTEGSRVNNVTW